MSLRSSFATLDRRIDWNSDPSPRNFVGSAVPLNETINSYTPTCDDKPHLCFAKSPSSKQLQSVCAAVGVPSPFAPRKR
ncbi:MAG: hypothetical protein ACTS44_00755 [Candidatus Hodgkinia cicadicola]